MRSERVNQIISAVIPDTVTDPQLFDSVASHIIHGLRGALSMTWPCMVDRKCKKRFPKHYINDTITDIDGNTLYSSRNAVVTHLQCECQNLQIKLKLIISG